MAICMGNGMGLLIDCCGLMSGDDKRGLGLEAGYLRHASFCRDENHEIGTEWRLGNNFGC